MSLYKRLDNEILSLNQFEIKTNMETSRSIFYEFVESAEYLELNIRLNSFLDNILANSILYSISDYVNIFRIIQLKIGKDRILTSMAIDLITKFKEILNTRINIKTNKIRLIGISGKMGSGKSLISNIISKNFTNFEQKSFAENIRKIMYIISGVRIDNTRTIKHKNVYLPDWDKTVGQMLQAIGGGLIKSINQDVWTKSLFNEYDTFDLSYWVIDDVRFPSNAEAIKSRGGIIIRLEGKIGLTTDSRNPNDYSETALDDYQDFDIVINTDDYNRDFDKLESDIIDLLTPLLK